MISKSQVRRFNIRITFIALCTCIFLLIMTLSQYLFSSPRSRPIQHNAAFLWEEHERQKLDIHQEGPERGHVIVREDPVIGLSDSVVSRSKHQHSHTKGNRTSIAIGLAITARDQEFLTIDNVPYRTPFLKSLFPSFCKTASPGFDYHFYVAFDNRDPFLSREEYLQAIYKRFIELKNQLCLQDSGYHLHFVQCSHNRSPSWAQNDAMIEAYLDGIDYYYRVNDDTQMMSPHWTSAFIEGLQNFNPPNVGVVGPVHRGGNEVILTYDFVHRTHIDIFGYYYPRLFTDWWADNWMTEVYGGERTLKLPSVRVMHTLEAGTRYKVQYDISQLLKYQISEDRATLKRYLQYKLSPPPKSDNYIKIISMSLWGAEPRYTFGALRNAQLGPVFFPDWKLRVYVEKPGADGKTVNKVVPERIIAKLADLGAEILYVNAQQSRIPPMMWRFLVADDMSLDYFIVRDADGRLSDRDAIIVKEWIDSGETFHCIRDHPSHSQYALLGGLWGAKPRKLRDVLSIPWQDLMMGYRQDYIMDMAFLANAVWPKVNKHAYCHDSVSCTTWPAAHPFPLARSRSEHLGQVFDAFGNPRDDDVKIIMQRPPVEECYTNKYNLSIAVDTKFLGLTFEGEGTGKTGEVKHLPEDTQGQFEGHGRSQDPVKVPDQSQGQFQGYDHKQDQYQDAQQNQGQVAGYVNSRDQRQVPIDNQQSQFHRQKQNINGNLHVDQHNKEQDLWQQENQRKTFISSNNSQNLKRENKFGNFTLKLKLQDLVTSNAQVKSETSQVIWSVDFHSGAIRAVKNILSSMQLKFLDQSFSSLCRFSGNCAKRLRVLTKKNSMVLEQSTIDRFYQEYENDPEINLVTHFLCTYPASLCELYMPFNRHIIVYITHRYEMGRYSTEKWESWNKNLLSIALDPENTVAASNEFDSHYVEYFTGLRPQVIPLHCRYVNSHYNSVKQSVLLVSTQNPTFEDYLFGELDRERKRDLNQTGGVYLINDLYPEYTFQDIASHLAVIHIPYQVSTVTFCEHYYMNIPIFVPTVQLLIEWHLKFDLLSAMTLNHIRDLEGFHSNASPLPAKTQAPDPNDYMNKESLNFWVPLFEFYHKPHVILFNSIQDLVDKIHNLPLTDASIRMAQENSKKLPQVLDQWRRVFKGM